MAEERTYIIPLRREFLKVPRYRRAKRAISEIRKFSKKHMKMEDVRIGRDLNMKVMEKGTETPPHKVQVKIMKFDEYVRVDLPDVDLEKLDKSFKKEDEKDSKKEIKKEEVKEEKTEGGMDKKEKKDILEHAKLDKLKPKIAEQKIAKKSTQVKQAREKIVSSTGKR
jgi:large subunit ribosomal protein L31e